MTNQNSEPKRRGRPPMTDEQKRLSALKRAAEKMKLAVAAPLREDAEVDEHYQEAVRSEGVVRSTSLDEAKQAAKKAAKHVDSGHWGDPEARPDGDYLVIHGFGVNANKIATMGDVANALNRIVVLADVPAISGTLVSEMPIKLCNVPPYEDDGGVSGVVMVSVGHCILRTFPARNHYTLSLHSARPFEHDQITGFLQMAFGPHTATCINVFDT